MKDKLSQLSDEALFNLKIQVNEEAKRRSEKALTVGKMATFAHSKTGKLIKIMILKRGPKNILGYEISETGVHMTDKKWRVSGNLLTPFIKVEPKAIPTGIGADRPAEIGNW